MKKMRFLAALMACLMLAVSFFSCEKDEEQTNNTSNQGQTTAFFPTGYDRSAVVAWFTGIEYQSDGQVNVQAIYIFNDGSMLATLYKKKANGTERREIGVTGTCRLTSGDYTNGTAIVSIPSLGMEMNITIRNGVFSVEGVTFTKQDNDKIPAAQEPTGDNGGGTNSSTLLTDAYLPAAYGDKTIVAWYAFSNQENDRIKTEAVFLFDDNTLVVTKHKEYTSGRAPENEIEAEGTYRLTEGDYENGTASVMAGDRSITATIVNGVLSAMGEQFTKQDNANAPEPTQKENNGGENGGEGEVSATAYLPASFATGKTIAAWYSNTNETSDRVRIEAVFLFTDNTMVVTKSKVYFDGRTPNFEKEIEFTATYELIEGDYENGIASATVEGQVMRVQISNGILMVSEDNTFTKQDNADAPAPTE